MRQELNWQEAKTQPTVGEHKVNPKEHRVKAQLMVKAKW